MEPSVSSFVVARLRQSPFLAPIATDKGITAFAINPDATGDQILDPKALLDELRPESSGPIYLLDGWHQLETYPDQRPFRWTTGLSARALHFNGQQRPRTVSLEYKAPIPPVRLTINGQSLAGKEMSLPGGWTRLVVPVDAIADVGYLDIAVLVPGIFRAPPDTREFGCMVRYIIVE